MVAVSASASYAEQPNPGGLAQAFIIGRTFVGNDTVCLVLGDNLFYGHGMTGLCRMPPGWNAAATVFAYHVTDPERYGVVEFDAAGKAIGLEEKPEAAALEFRRCRALLL